MMMTNLSWLSVIRKEELRKRGDFLQNSCRSNLKKKELGFPRLIHTLIPLTILWYRNLIQSHFNFNYINNDEDGVNDLFTYYAGSTKTRAQAMYKTRTLPIGKPGEA